MGKKVYGGLLFEDIVNETKGFELQLRLFEKGFINGTQIRVAHPIFTPSIAEKDLPNIAKRLPRGFEVFIHFGAENVGVDFGEVLDEKEVFAKQNKGKSWLVWNGETSKFGIEVAKAFGVKKPYGVIHPGYTIPSGYLNIERCVLPSLKTFGVNKEEVLFENILPVVIKSQYPSEDTKNWQDFYFGIGGVPSTMGFILRELRAKCLIDFTHIIVAQHQMSKGYLFLENRLIEGFLYLPHSDICHFSGIPKGLIDEHTDLSEDPSLEVTEALQVMETVCLEIPFHKMTLDQAKKAIDRFREGYKFY